MMPMGFIFRSAFTLMTVRGNANAMNREAATTTSRLARILISMAMLRFEIHEAPRKSFGSKGNQI